MVIIHQAIILLQIYLFSLTSVEQKKENKETQSKG